MKYFFLLFVTLLTFACSTEEAIGIKVLVSNKTDLDISVSDFERLDCKKILPSLKDDRLKNNPIADLMRVNIKSFTNDTVDFNIELFRTMENGQSYRVANYGGRKMPFSKDRIKETVCRFVNK